MLSLGNIFFPTAASGCIAVFPGGEAGGSTTAFRANIEGQAVQGIVKSFW